MINLSIRTFVFPVLCTSLIEHFIAVHGEVSPGFVLVIG